MQIHSRIGVCAIAIAAALAPLSNAVAKTFGVPPGKTTAVGAYGVFQKVTCDFPGISKTTIHQPPNGKFHVKEKKEKIGGKSFCKDIIIPKQIIFYTPNKGFHGRDCGKIVFFHPDFRAESQHTGHPQPICVNVK